MIGAAKLDTQTYRDVENDRSATGQAALVVILVSVASGIGFIGTNGVIGLLYGIVFGLLAWAVFALLAYWIGAKLLPRPETHADWGQLARTLAFARAPGMLFIFGIIGLASGVIGSLILFVINVWIIVASVIAIREALDYGNDTLRAVAVTVLAYIPMLIILGIVTSID